MNRLLIRGEPVGPFQHLYVFYNGEIAEILGISYEDLVEIVFALLQKYNLKKIDLSGSRSYMVGIETAIKEAGIATYNINDLTFQYV